MLKFRLFALANAAAILFIAPPVLADNDALEMRLTPMEVAKVPTKTAGAGTSELPAVITTVLFGDPSKPGLYTIELKVAPNTIIQAHTHRDTRTAIVISGLWYFAYGPKNEEIGLKVLPPGSFYTEPGDQPHFARTGSEGAVLAITGYGPSDTVYVK